MLIVLEGGDACGKSELGKKLAKALQAGFIEFPDDTAYTGPMIRSYLRGEWALKTDYRSQWQGVEAHKRLGAMAFQSLQVANRMERMPKLEKAAGSRNNHMILVRYWQSGWVYGQLDGLSRQWLWDVHASMARADLNILLDLSVDQSLERIGVRGEGTERYEKCEFMGEVRELYLGLWLTEVLKRRMMEGDSGQWASMAWPVVDASGTREEVFAQVRDLVNVALGVIL